MKVIVKGLRRCQSEIEEVRDRALALVNAAFKGEHEVRFNDLDQKNSSVAWFEIETHPFRDRMTHVVTDKFIGLKALNGNASAAVQTEQNAKEEMARGWDLGVGL